MRLHIKSNHKTPDAPEGDGRFCKAPSMRSSSGREIFFQKARQQLVQVSRRILTLTDVVPPIWILHHRELFPGGYQCVHQNFSTLVVNVIVARSVYDQKLAFEAAGVSPRGSA